MKTNVPQTDPIELIQQQIPSLSGDRQRAIEIAESGTVIGLEMAGFVIVSAETLLQLLGGRHG